MFLQPPPISGQGLKGRVAAEQQEEQKKVMNQVRKGRVPVVLEEDKEARIITSVKTTRGKKVMKEEEVEEVEEVMVEVGEVMEEVEEVMVEVGEVMEEIEEVMVEVEEVMVEAPPKKAAGRRKAVAATKEVAVGAPSPSPVKRGRRGAAPLQDREYWAKLQVKYQLGSHFEFVLTCICFQNINAAINAPETGQDRIDQIAELIMATGWLHFCSKHLFILCFRTLFYLCWEFRL